MRILLDECVHAGAKAAFAGHEIRTVAEMGWRGSKDGYLLRLSEDSFDVLVTIDRNLEHQQNLHEVRLGIVVARVHNNKIESYHPIFSGLLQAVERVKQGELIHVP